MRPMLEHGVEHGHQFPHAGDERNFLGFSQSTQALIERLDCLVVSVEKIGRESSLEVPTQRRGGVRSFNRTL